MNSALDVGLVAITIRGDQVDCEMAYYDTWGTRQIAHQTISILDALVTLCKSRAPSVAVVNYQSSAQRMAAQEVRHG